MSDRNYFIVHCPICGKIPFPIIMLKPKTFKLSCGHLVYSPEGYIGIYQQNGVKIIGFESPKPKTIKKSDD